MDARTAFLIALVIAALLMVGFCWAAGLIDIGTPPEESTKDNYDDRP